MTKQILFEPGNFYYLRTPTIGKDKAFINDGNYNFFIARYCDFFLPLAQTCAFCLLPNQFHFIFKIAENDFSDNYKNDTPEVFSHVIASEFGKIISSYTQIFNLINNRNGGLFIRPYKRGLISDYEELANLIKHIHLLPVALGYVDAPQYWKHSSYPFLTNYRASFFDARLIQSVFYSMEAVTNFHQYPSDIEPEFPNKELISIAA